MPEYADDELAAHLRAAIMRLRRRLVQETDSELSIPAMTVLGLLHRRGEQTVGQLAAAERVQPPSMTRTVTCLERDGLVARRQGESDRRQVVVSITEDGRTRLAADRDRRTEWLARRLADLTPDERAVLDEAAPILEGLATA
ncbi:MarR family winged helix-turn-helix transcriptional regulator [Nocardioides insulae]|uniref:MarR family winged helix-turn-helix transcriptional regulator n=1 Tax=Nocardioides insulae TaxID=394734 RepID=UPI0004090FF2|nr:MarR family transcriptional regulator [Nocardioides insulae]